jgi:hypothetical protein
VDLGAGAVPGAGRQTPLSWLVVVIAALVVSIVAAAGSVGAVWYSRRSAKSAAVSAAAASATAALDSQRRHGELTPEFDISITAGENGVGEHAEMRVTFTGPPGLDRLDAVTVDILDEAGVDHWAHGLPGKVNEEQARAFVWGPWEFNTGASAQVTDNRTTRPRVYSRPDGKNWDRLALTRTRPGHWMGSMTPEQWRREHVGPVRLRILCARGTEEWELLREIHAMGTTPAELEQ